MTTELRLAGVAEIAELLGISRQRVNKIVQTREDFPEPVAHLSAGRVWLLDDIENWIERSGRNAP